jgi:hypothetical protein
MMAWATDHPALAWVAVMTFVFFWSSGLGLVKITVNHNHHKD